MKKVVLKNVKINSREFLLLEASNVKSTFLEHELSAKWAEAVRGYVIEKTHFDLRSIFSICRRFRVYLNYSAIKDTSETPKNARLTIKATSKHNTYVKQFTEWMQQKRYSMSTQKTYTQVFSLFSAFHKDRDIEQLEGKDIERFINDYIIPNGLSASYQNQVINACKLFYSKVLGRKVVVEKLERPKRVQALPHVLSKEEVKAILQSTTNIKHRTILSLIYACGLRRGELIHLRVSDIQGQRKCIMVRKGKGGKDRMIPVSDNILNMLRDYYRTYKPKLWLFEGQKLGAQYSPGSVRAILKAACKKAGINKPVTPHWLRHSYATHLMESGTDTRFVQELLGHKSIKTTTIYTHVTQKSLEKIRSPFDDL